MTSFLSHIKQLNKKTSRSFIGSDKYWQKSPSNMLLKKAVEVALARYAKNKKLLDAGAGRLAYKPLVTKYTQKYVSSDFDKTHPQLDVVTDIEKMSFKNRSFDVVLCSQVLEHVPHPWLALTEINRVLKKDGIGIITVPLFGYIHNAPYDFYRYTHYGLKSLAQDAGFHVVSVVPLGGFFSYLGYVRSSAVMSLFSVPILGEVLYWVNMFISKAEIVLDSLLKTEKLFPLNYVMIVRK